MVVAPYRSCSRAAVKALHRLMNPGLAGRNQYKRRKERKYCGKDSLDGSSLVLLIESRQAATSGGKKLRFGSQF